MAAVAHLTNQVAESTKPPPVGTVEIRDDEFPALRLRVSSSGRRSWHYYGWHGTGPKRRAIGVFPKISATGARDRARRIALALDTDTPEPGRRALGRPAVMLEALWNDYLAAVGPHLRPKSMAEKSGIWNRHLKNWADVPADTLSRTMVTRLLDEIGKSHPVTANRVLKTIRALYSWSRDRGYTTQDPAAGIGKFRERSRDRFLQSSELPAFWKALMDPKTPAHLRHYVLLSIATGQRKMNVLAMRWDDIDFTAGVWSIPGETAKSGEPLVVPLLPMAVTVLQERLLMLRPAGMEQPGPAGCEGRRLSGWVFPARSGSRSGHATELKKGWESLLKRAGLDDLHLHDLRRTLGSWMAMGGASMAIIGRALGHKDQQATAIYARLAVDPVAAAMQAAVDALSAAAEAKSAGASETRQ